MNTLAQQAMPKQVSALNAFWLIDYLKLHFPKVDVEKLVQRVQAKGPYFIENLRTGQVEPLSLIQLVDVKYWVSNVFMMDVYDQIQQAIGDPLLGSKAEEAGGSLWG